MYLVNILKQCISHVEKGEFDPVLNDAINGLRVYVDEKSRNIEVAVSVTPTPSRSKKRKLTQTQHIHQDNTHNTNSKNSIEDTVIPDTQEDAISSLSSSSISNKRPKRTNHIDTISPSSSLPQSQLFESEDVSWNQHLSEMKSYIHRNKGTLELDIDKMGPELFIWTYTQSSMYKSNLLSESRKSDLAQIDEFVMFSNAESGGFEAINNEINNDIDMNHQSTDQELQLNDTLKPLEASIEIEEPQHKDNNISTTNLIPNSTKDTSKRKQRNNDNWNKNLLKLKAYIKSHNTLESISGIKERPFYGWVNSQKASYINTVEGKENKPKLSQERMDQLNQIKEFLSYTKCDGLSQRKKRYDAIWNEHLSELKAYIQSNNNTLDVCQGKMGKELYEWTARTKSSYNSTLKGEEASQILSHERMDQLNQIKEFVEYCNVDHKEKNDTKWCKNLEDLKAYLQRENKTNDEKDTMEINRDKMGVTLHGWIMEHRRFYVNTVEGSKSKRTLPQWRMDKLNEVKLFVKFCNNPEFLNERNKRKKRII